jgi:hypothetical protein
MNTITFNGKEYPTRTFKVMFEGSKHTYKIATDSLYDALGDDKEIHGSEANEIDNEIYFYVEDDVINLDAVEICQDCLDEPMEFISEELITTLD